MCEEVVHCLLPPVLYFSLLLADESPHGKVICREVRLWVIQRLEAATCLCTSLFYERGIDLPLSAAQPCSRKDFASGEFEMCGLGMRGE